MNKIKLVPHSNKGKNRVREIKLIAPDWDGKTWRIRNHSHTVLFSPTIGGWLFVEPDIDDLSIANDRSRWINQFSDENFTVER